jgi:hypothetical protein
VDGKHCIQDELSVMADKIGLISYFEQSVLDGLVVSFERNTSAEDGETAGLGITGKVLDPAGFGGSTIAYFLSSSYLDFSACDVMDPTDIGCSTGTSVVLPFLNFLRMESNPFHARIPGYGG